MIKLIEHKVLVESLSSNEELEVLIKRLRLMYKDYGENDFENGRGRFVVKNPRPNPAMMDRYGMYYPVLNIFDLSDGNEEIYGIINLDSDRLREWGRYRVYGILKAGGMTPRRLGILLQNMDIYTSDGEDLRDVLQYLSEMEDEVPTVKDKPYINRGTNFGVRSDSEE